MTSPEKYDDRPPLLVVLAVACLLALTLTGCQLPWSDEEGDDGSGGTAEEADVEDAMLEYAQCMREHGVDMKDPEANGGGIGIAVPAEGSAEKDKVDKANEACKQHLPNGGEPEKPTAEDLDKAREMAKCLREHGIDVKEPTMDDPGIAIAGGPGDDPEKVNKAMEACAPEDARIGTQGEPAK